MCVRERWSRRRSGDKGEVRVSGVVGVSDDRSERTRRGECPWGDGCRVGCLSVCLGHQGPWSTGFARRLFSGQGNRLGTELSTQIRGSLMTNGATGHGPGDVG